MDHGKVINCYRGFLSCPSDVLTEKQLIIEAVNNWNIIRSKDTGCFLSVITWENIVAPNLADRGQTVISQAVGDDYDVFLGLMWGRFGAPTGVAASGTVEEFDRALDRYRGGDRLRLCMLFKVADLPAKNLNGEQFDKVRDFKKRFATEGGLYREFSNDDHLRNILHLLFEDIARNSESFLHINERKLDPSPPETREASGLIDEEDEKGILDLNQELTEVTSEQVIFLDKIGCLSQKQAEETAKATADMQDLTRFGTADGEVIRPIINIISGSMNKISGYIEENLAKFSEGNSRIVSILEQILDISEDFADAENQKMELKESVLSLLKGLNSNIESIGGLSDTVKSLPRMTTDFNRAKKRFVNAQGSLLDDLKQLRGYLETAMSAF